jgi:hypothetical protein
MDLQNFMHTLAANIGLWVAFSSYTVIKPMVSST